MSTSNDISKCFGKDCKFKDKCWRFRCPGNSKWQSYMDFPGPKKAEDCEGFWPLSENQKKFLKEKK